MSMDFTKKLYCFIRIHIKIEKGADFSNKKCIMHRKKFEALLTGKAELSIMNSVQNWLGCRLVPQNGEKAGRSSP